VNRRRLRILACGLGICSILLAGCVPPPPRSAGDISSSTVTTPTVVSQTPTRVTTATRLLIEARQFVYRVRNVACLETGTTFTTAQGFVTNRHVASGATSVELSNWEGMDFDSDLQAISGGADLALLDDNFSEDTAATLATPALAPGTKVWVAGYPKGDQLSVTAGVVLDYTAGSRFAEPGRLMEITNEVEPGNSGSPLMDRAGQVVGVVFALETKSGHGLVIPASTLARFLVSPGDNTFGNCDD
jgi:S1-C subfamily serine protease